MFGGGAIGSLYAAKLSACIDVTLVGRADHVRAIGAAGLRIIGREDRTVPLSAVEDAAAIAPHTLVLLTTKVNANATAAATLRSVVRDDTVVLCVQNGLGGEEIVKEGLEHRCVVLRAVTQFGAIHHGPGVIDFKVAGHTFVESHAVSATVASLLTAAGLDGRVSEAIDVEVWRKLIANCVINPVTAICGTEVGSIANPMLDPVKIAVIDECLRVAAADGVTLEGMTPETFNRRITEIFGPSRNIASMRQDLIKKRPTEIDFMNGAVVAHGRRAGIACPVNAALVALVKMLEARAS